MDFITSGNVYSYLTSKGLLTAPIIFGPDKGLIDTYKRLGEDKRMSRIGVVNIINTDNLQKREIIIEILNKLKKWGVTNITFAVDLDVLSPKEGVFAVRYSPIAPYLGLGCQILPDDITPDHLIALKQIQFPIPQARFLLQEDRIRKSQKISYCRQFAHENVDGVPALPLEDLTTDVGVGNGLKMNEVLSIIRMIKSTIPNYGIKDGIKLKTGGLYRGAIVEWCGYEDANKKTSSAAIRLNQAIVS